jgi:hypothetical protein
MPYDNNGADRSQWSHQQTAWSTKVLSLVTLSLVIDHIYTVTHTVTHKFCF